MFDTLSIWTDRLCRSKLFSVMIRCIGRSRPACSVFPRGHVEPGVKAQHLAYIDKYWDTIAAFAWQEFITHGRGALVVENGHEPEDDDTVFVPLTMLTDSPVVHEYAALVQNYDPRREVVIIFLSPPCSVSAYTGTLVGRNSPPQAYNCYRAAISIAPGES